MELLFKISKKKTQQTLLENALYCAGLLGVEKAKELFPQYATELEEVRKDNPGSSLEHKKDL